MENKENANTGTLRLVVFVFVVIAIIGIREIQKEPQKTELSFDSKLGKCEIVDGIAQTINATLVLYVRGESMLPAIQSGNVVICKKEDFFDIRPGEIIAINVTADEDWELIGHRVIGSKLVNGQLIYRTKGDANRRADSFLTTKENYVCNAKIILYDNFTRCGP